MLENTAPYSRLLFVFALVCAAVMSFIMCSDAARARPITTQVDHGAKHKVLRRLYNPQSQHHPLFTGLSTETGLQTATNRETETSGNYGEASLIIDHQSNPVQFIKGSFSYNQNIPDNKQSRAGITGLRSEVRPASGIFTRPSQHGAQSFERRQSTVNYHPPSQEVAQSGNSYYSHPAIIRKSSRNKAASPFHQSSPPSQVDAQKSYNKIPRNDSPKVAEDETVWQPPDSSLFSSQTGRYWSTSLPASRGYFSGYKETNGLGVVGPRSTSSGIEASKILAFASQTAPHAPSISNSLDASVIKSNPSPVKPVSSITDVSQGLRSVSSSETPRHKKVQSYLFRESQTSSGGHETVNTATGDGHSAFFTRPQAQGPSDGPFYGWLSSNFIQSQREEPTKEVQHLSDNVNPVYHNANTAQSGAQISTDNTMENFVPTPYADFQRGSEKSVVRTLVNATTRGSTHVYKPGQTIKSIYGFRGFKNPTWRAVREPSILSSSGSNAKINSQRYSFDKEMFKITNTPSSLSRKYSFGQREESTPPAKLGRTPTDYPSPSPGTLDIVQITTPPRPFTSGFKEAWPLLPESDAGMDSKPDRRQFRIYRRIYGLKGFDSRPLEGAKPLVSEPDKSEKVQQGFEGLKLRSSQIWQPKSSKIERWHNKTEPGSSHVSTMSQNDLSIEDLKPLLKTAGSTESVTRFTPDTYRKNHKIYASLGFHPGQNRIGNVSKTHWKYKEHNPTMAQISSAILRSAEVESRSKSEPRPPNKTEPVAMEASLLNSSTSSTVRGKRVKGKHASGKKPNEAVTLSSVAIVRLPKRLARVKAVTYADILGSASFSGVRAIKQTAIRPTDKDYYPNTTATITQKAAAGHWSLKSEDTLHSRDNTSRSPEAQAEDEGEFSSVAENKLVKSEGVDSDMKTSESFLDNEGSGSGAFNMSDVFSADTTKSKGLSEDLLELDYLRKSTGNISFKSMKLSHTEK